MGYKMSLISHWIYFLNHDTLLKTLFENKTDPCLLLLFKNDN